MEASPDAMGKAEKAVEEAAEAARTHGQELTFPQGDYQAPKC